MAEDEEYWNGDEQQYNAEWNEEYDQYAYVDYEEKEQVSESSKADAALEAELLNAFNTVDEEGTGVVDLGEIGSLCKLMNKKLTTYEMNKALVELDTTGDMVIVYEDFVRWWKETQIATEEEEEAVVEVEEPDPGIWEEVTDLEGNLYYYNSTTEETKWELPELVYLVQNKLQKMFNDAAQDYFDSELKLRKLFDRYDVDKTGSLDVDEFEDLMAALGKPSRGIGVELQMKYIIKDPERAKKKSLFVEAEDFLNWWQLNAPLKKRVQLDHEWEKITDEVGVVEYQNRRTGKRRWDEPGMPAKMAKLLEESYDDNMEKLYCHYAAPSTGQINIDSFKKLMDTLGQPMKLAQLKYAWSCIDTDGDNNLSINEFMGWWKEKHFEYELGDWEEAFDEDGNLYYYNRETQETSWEAPQLSNKMDLMVAKYSDDLTMDEKIRRIFLAYDTDDTGTIDTDEFSKMCTALGQPLTGAALKSAMDSIDDSGDGEISLDEFTKWWMDKQEAQKEAVEQEAQLAFETKVRDACKLVLGKENATTFDVNDISRVSEVLGRPVRGKTLLRAIHALDSSGTRRVNVESFIRWWKSFEYECERKEAEKRQEDQLIRATEAWEEKINPANGKVYYVNSRTGEVQWEAPSMHTGMQKLLLRIQKENSSTLSKTDQIKQIFHEFDADGSGTIDKTELAELTRSLGQTLTERQLDAAMESLDTSGDGEIMIDEFVAWWICFQRRPVNQPGTSTLKEEAIVFDEDKYVEKPFTGPIRQRYAGIENLPDKFDPRVVECVVELVQDVISITPLYGPDAAARIQRCFRSRKARLMLVEALQLRYVKKVDGVTGHAFYVNKLTGQVRMDEPTVLGAKQPILTPRSKLRAKHRKERLALKRRWFDKNSFSTTEHSISKGVYFRTAAFIVYDVLCSIKSRIKKGIWNAFEQDNLTLAQLVIRMYPKQLERRGPKGFLPPHFAVQHSDFPISVLNTIVDGRDSTLLETDRAGQTPLHLACRDNARLEVVKVLLSTKIGREAAQKQSINGETPLHLALAHRAKKDVVNCLLSALDESSLVLTNKRKQTPLHVAMEKYRHMPSTLLEKMVNLNPRALLVKDRYGNLPIHVGLQHRKPEFAISLFVKCRPVSLKARNSTGMLPIHVALKQNNFYLPCTIKLIFRAMLKQSLATEFRSKCGFTVLHYALQYHACFDTIESIMLLDTTAVTQPSAVTEDLPLHIAARETADLNIVKALIEANPKACLIRNKAGDLPIHKAIIQGRNETVNLLLLLCPWSVSERSGSNHDPLMLSANQRHSMTVAVKNLLDPPPLAPKRHPYDIVEDASPFYISSTRPNSELFEMLRHTDQERDMLTLAKKQMRNRFHQPSPKWEFDKILRLMEVNPLSETIQMRSLLAIYQKLVPLSESEAEAAYLKYGLVKAVNRTMYEYPDNLRLRMMAMSCINQLLPTAFAKERYRCNVDQFFKL